MPETQNGYPLQDPYLPGTNDAWANAPAAQGRSTAMEQPNVTVPIMPARPTASEQTGMPVSSQEGAGNNNLNMRHGLSNDVIGNPISAQEAYLGSMRAMLGREIGAYIAATFLMGTNELVRWEGRLYEVGNNYIVIYQQEAGRYVVGDLNSLLFVEFSETGNRFPLTVRPCNNSPTAW